MRKKISREGATCVDVQPTMRPRSPVGASCTKNYEQWIAAHQPTDPRGKCFEVTVGMAVAFPELRRVRGFYICPIDGQRHAHWWMETPAGKVIDPTAAQFPSNGAGDYEEYTGPEPTGHCLNCNAMLFTGEYFCNTECAYETAVFMGRDGGDVFVNDIQVSPSRETITSHD